MIEFTSNQIEKQNDLYGIRLGDGIIVSAGKDISKHADADIVLGGSTPDRFLPNINGSKWDDEAFININFADMLVDKEIVEFADKKLIQTVGNIRQNMYLAQEGLEWEIVYASRPPTDVAIFDLTFTPGTRFLPQRSLLEDYQLWPESFKSFEDYCKNRYRPENVFDSYVIRYPKRNNKYKTGKMTNWYRNKLVDADGNWTWVEKFEILADSAIGKAYIYMPKAFLDNARYPITLGPNLGWWTPVGSSTYGNNARIYYLADDTDGTGGNVDNYHMAIAAVDGSNDNIKMGLYTQGTSDPDSLIEQVEFNSVSVSDDNSIAAGGSALSASTTYWIGWIPQSDNTTGKYDTGDGDDQALQAISYASAMPASAVPDTSNAGFTMWVDYSTGTHTEPKYPTLGETVSEAPHSDNTWTSPTNIYADDGNTAYVHHVQFDLDDQTYVLKATGFDFSSIPAGATIDGIVCRVNGWYVSGEGSGSLDLLQLLDTSKAKVGTNQCSTPVALTTIDTTVIIKGGTADKWGNALTRSWVQNSNFGVAIGIIATADNADVDVDYVTLDVFYTEVGAIERDIAGSLSAMAGALIRKHSAKRLMQGII